MPQKPRPAVAWASAALSAAAALAAPAVVSAADAPP
ncbi:MAG: hypothetical protein JWO31_714, partial [Phycisphaerales bacterium]|nr:hypothetical protein [Phycisphaerales bacterium]